jgi:hydroxyacylglutathione hydrolase
MKIKIFVVNPFQINCFIYYNEISGDAVLIDPGAYYQSEKDNIKDFVKNNNIKIKYIINTHGHFDHTLGNNFAKETFNVPLLIHYEDKFLLDSTKEQGLIFGCDINPSPAPDEFITESFRIKLGEDEISFIHTPGHTPGSICVVNHKEKIIFCGDLIFRNSIGRTDLHGGDYKTLMNSIENKLFKQCSDNYMLYPGHHQKTTIGEEKIHNQFLNNG